MTQVLILVTTSDFLGPVGEENFAKTDLNLLISYFKAMSVTDDPMYELVDTLAEKLEKIARSCTCIDWEEDIQDNTLAELKAGNIVALAVEETQVVYAPLIQKDGETIDECQTRIRIKAAEAMSNMYPSEKNHPWDNNI